jgi:hypothetical protein
MTRDEVAKMASMAGFETKGGMVWVDQWEVTRTMERFAALVAAAEREACKDAVRFADNGTEAVELIRARGEK